MSCAVFLPPPGIFNLVPDNEKVLLAQNHILQGTQVQDINALIASAMNGQTSIPVNPFESNPDFDFELVFQVWNVIEIDTNRHNWNSDR